MSTYPNNGEDRAAKPENAQTTQMDTLTGLSNAEGEMAQELFALAEGIHPDPGFTARLKGELDETASTPPTWDLRFHRRFLEWTAGLRTVSRWIPSLAGAALLITVLTLSILLIPKNQGGGPAQATGSTPTVAAQPWYYTVQTGDTLSGVALKTGVGLKDLLSLNGLQPDAQLQAGQRLVVGFSGGPTKEPPQQPARHSVADAERLVRAWYQNDRPDLNPQVAIPLIELTTAEIWTRLGVQVFQVSGDIFQYYTFLIREGQVQAMGMGVGGVGVNSLAVTDLDGDGQPELLFTYSFGSGLHRSLLALYSPALPGNGILTADVALLNGDMRIRKTTDQQVTIEGAVENQNFIPIGQPILQNTAGKTHLVLQLNQGLPADIINNLSTQAIYPPTGLPAGSGTLAMMADVGGVSQVFVLPADGGSWQIVSDGLHAANWPSLSPDGSQIVFAVNDGGDGYNYNLVVADLASEQIRKLTNDAFNNSHPVWSPDGKQIAFESDRDHPQAMVDIYLIDADGSHLRLALASPGPRSLAGWSADSKEIYFTFTAQDPSPADQSEILAAYSLESGQTRQIHRFPMRIRGSVQATVSPDGQQIAYVKDSDTSSVIMLRQGGADKQASDGIGDVFLPVWSPDGKWLVYAEQINGSLVPVFVQMIGGVEVHRYQGLSGQVSSWTAANNIILFQPTAVPLPETALPTATQAPPEP